MARHAGRRGGVRPPDPDGNGMASVETNGPGITKSVGCARLEGDPGAASRCGWRSAFQDVADVPGRGGREDACRGALCSEVAIAHTHLGNGVNERDAFAATRNRRV